MLGRISGVGPGLFDLQKVSSVRITKRRREDEGQPSHKINSHTGACAARSLQGFGPWT